MNCERCKQLENLLQEAMVIVRIEGRRMDTTETSANVYQELLDKVDEAVTPHA